MARFNKKIQKFLKSVAHQPWGVNRYGHIRVLCPVDSDVLDRDTEVCPICMWGNIKEKRWKFATFFWHVENTGLSDYEQDLIAVAADNKTSEYRAHLEELLGMTK